MAKRRVIAWVKGDIDRAIRAQATADGLTVSEIAAGLLEQAVAAAGEAASMPLLRPIIEAAVRRMSDRLAHLLVRAALEAATTRRLVFQLLVRQVGEADARRLNEAAWTASVEALRKPASGVREVLGVTDDGDGR